MVDSSTKATPNVNPNNGFSVNQNAGATESTWLAPISAGGVLTAANAAGTPLAIPVPFQNSIVLVEDMRVAGTTHIHDIDDIVERTEIGTQLRFEREPGNLVDNWAIRVYAGDKAIGYVPADCNEMLARMMDGGKALSAKLTTKEKVGMWNKLQMEVVLDD